MSDGRDPAMPGVSESHRSVSRALAVIEVVASSTGGVTLTELATALSAPKSSLHPVLKILVRRGYLAQDGTRYGMGRALASLSAVAQPSVVQAARPSMVELARRFGETVMLGAMLGDTLVYLDTIESDQLVRYSPPRVRPPMANPSSIMKLYLGQLSDGELAAYLDQHIAVESRGRLEEEIQKARVEGVAFNRGDTFSDLSAVAAAIISRGVLTACIAVGGPTARVGPRCEEMADALRTAGNDIADRLEPVFGVER